MTTRADRATVLAVDERRQTRRRFERRLGDDHEVLTAESADVALEMLDQDVDVVFLARTPSVADSDEVLFSIRSAGYDCRVAMVAGEEPARDVVEAGFDALLVEPVSASELSATVDRLLARTSYESQLDELYQLCVKRAKARADGGVDSPDTAGLDRPGNGDAGDDRADDGRTGDAATGDVAEIEARIREIRDSVDETVSAFETTDYRASFRDLPAVE